MAPSASLPARESTRREVGSDASLFRPRSLSLQVGEFLRPYGESRLVAVRHACPDRMLRSRYGNVRGVVVPGSGHWLIEEAPQAVLPELVAFLNGQTAAAASSGAGR